MPSMLGAITALSLTATAGIPYGDLTKPDPVTGARPNDGQFTQLQITGTAGAVRTYVAKTETNEDTKFGVDTYRLVFTMGDVSNVDVQVTDGYRVVFTMNAVALLSRAATDTYRPVMTMLNTSLTKSGTISKSAVDTYTPVLTMTAGLVTSLSSTDTYTVTLTMAGAVSASGEVLVTDTYTVVMDEVVETTAEQAFFSFAREDTYTVVFDMTARLGDFGEVDKIIIKHRPYYLIRINDV